MIDCNTRLTNDTDHFDSRNLHSPSTHDLSWSLQIGLVADIQKKIYETRKTLCPTSSSMTHPCIKFYVIEDLDTIHITWSKCIILVIDLKLHFKILSDVSDLFIVLTSGCLENYHHLIQVDNHTMGIFHVHVTGVFVVSQKSVSFNHDETFVVPHVIYALLVLSILSRHSLRLLLEVIYFLSFSIEFFFFIFFFDVIRLQVEVSSFTAVSHVYYSNLFV